MFICHKHWATYFSSRTNHICTYIYNTLNLPSGHVPMYESIYCLLFVINKNNALEIKITHILDNLVISSFYKMASIVVVKELQIFVISIFKTAGRMANGFLLTVSFYFVFKIHLSLQKCCIHWVMFYFWELKTIQKSIIHKRKNSTFSANVRSGLWSVTPLKT